MIEHILVFNDESQLWVACEELVREQLLWVESTGRRAGLFVSGGGTFVPLYERLGDFNADVFPVDERMVPPGSSADTGAMLVREWGDRLIHPQLTIHQVTRQGDAPSTAISYEQELRDWEAKGGFWGVALLGVGDDGHTASLFPGQHGIWEATPSWVVPAEGEQEPHVQRVSVSPALLAKVPRHITVMIGSEKTDVARSWLQQREPLPVEHVQPSDDRFVLLDRAAARDLDPQSYESR